MKGRKYRPLDRERLGRWEAEMEILAETEDSARVKEEAPETCTEADFLLEIPPVSLDWIP